MIAWELWVHRNDAQHGTSNPTSVSAESLLNQLIRIEYRQGRQGLAKADHHLFRLAQPQLLTKSLEYKRAWLANTNAARGVAEIPLPSQQNQRRLMRRWLRPSS